MNAFTQILVLTVHFWQAGPPLSKLPGGGIYQRFTQSLTGSYRSEWRRRPIDEEVFLRCS